MIKATLKSESKPCSKDYFVLLISPVGNVYLKFTQKQAVCLKAISKAVAVGDVVEVEDSWTKLREPIILENV